MSHDVLQRKSAMDYFGRSDARNMPGHFFSGAIEKDYSSTIKGNPKKQNYSVCPRYWYFDAVFECGSCQQRFTWTANEQKAWFEDYNFWIDSRPRLCKQCNANRRHLANLRKEYDATVASARAGGTHEQKMRIIQIVTTLEDAFTCLPEKMMTTKNLFEHQTKNG